MAISGMTYPVIPLYIVGSGLSVVVAGFVTSMASITSFCSQIAWGYISDRIGKRVKVMLYSSIIMILFYTVGVLLPDNILAIELSYIFSAIGSAGVGVASYALIADVGLGNLGRNMSLYWAGGSLGWATPLLFAGWLLKTYGVVSVFVVSLLLSVAILILVVVLMHTNKYASTTVSTRQDKWSLQPVARLLSNKRFLILYTSSFMFMVGDIIKNIYIPQYLAYRIGLGESIATAILSLASWFEIPFIIVFGHILSIISETSVYMLSLISMAAYLYFNSVIKSSTSASIAMACYSIVWASYITSISVLVPLSVGEEDKGLALGLVNSNFALANILSNIILSYMVDRYGYNQTFAATSALMILLTLAVSIGLRRRDNA